MTQFRRGNVCQFARCVRSGSDFVVPGTGPEPAIRFRPAEAAHRVLAQALRRGGVLLSPSLHGCRQDWDWHQKLNRRFT